jgi:hypothetical protein
MVKGNSSRAVGVKAFREKAGKYQGQSLVLFCRLAVLSRAAPVAILLSAVLSGQLSLAAAGETIASMGV